MSKGKFSVNFAEAVGGFLQGIVGALNIVLSKYRVTVFEILLFGLAIVEAMQGILAKGTEVAEASRGAKAFGHIGLFIIGFVAALVWAKEIRDIAKAAQSKNFTNVLKQCLDAVVVIVLMLLSVIGQTLTVLGAYGLSDEFMDMFMLQGIFYPLWGMLQYGSFPTMTVYIAYLHLLVLMYVGLKQLGIEDDDPYKTPVKPSVTPATTTPAPTPISLPPALSPTFLNELKEMYKTRSIGFSDFMFSNMIKEKDAQKLVPFVKDSHFNDQSDILKAILKYFNVTTDYSAELIKYESKLDDLLK